MMHRLASNALLTSHRLSKSAIRSFSHSPSLASTSPEQGLRPRMDWRTWFRSSDYDDAWSPFIPNSVSDDKLNGGKLMQQEPVKALIEGRWDKRRHGMNLEPLLLHPRQYEEISSDVTTNKIDNSIKSSIDWENDNAQQAISQARRRLRWLDSQTRFLCSMLDDLYRTGIRRQIDRARTERCHRIIGKLLTMTPAATRESSKQQVLQPFTFTGLAPRAAAILDRMERCSPIVLHHSNPNQINTDLVQNSHKTGRLRLPQHLPYTKHVLPYPTIQIYNMVLLLHAKESGPVHIAQQAEDVIWSMIERYMQQVELNTKNKEKYIIPSMENWNCVLRSWSISTDSDRAFHAYSFMKSWLEWNAHQGDMANEILEPDLVSYQLVLQSCLADTSNLSAESKSNDRTRRQERAAEVGSGVAIRLWQDMEKSALTLDSPTYLFALRSICQSANLANSSKLPAFSVQRKIFKRCCEDGLLTSDILEVIRKASNESQFAQLIGNKVSLVKKEKKALSTEVMLKNLPPEWVKNAT